MPRGFMNVTSTASGTALEDFPCERAGATPTWRALVAAEGGAPQPHQWAYMYWKKHYFS